MSWNGIAVGNYGQVGKLTFIDTDNSTAEDISTYSDTIQMIIKDPSGNQQTVTAAFDSDGTDGIIKYTVATGIFDESGWWYVRGKVTDTGNATLSTAWHKFRVID